MTFGPSKQDIAHENGEKQVVLTTFHFQPAFRTVTRARHPRGAVTFVHQRFLECLFSTKVSYYVFHQYAHFMCLVLVEKI